MRPKTYFVVLLGLMLAGATLLAWRQYQELVALRAAALGTEDRAALEDRLADLRKRNRELQAQLAALSGAKTNADYAVAAAKSAEKDRTEILLAKLAAATATADHDGAAKRDEQLELIAAMADLPEFQKLLALEQRGKIDAKYADLFRRLKLTPDELSRFQNLLAEKQSAYADATIAARSQGLTGKEARDLANAVANATQKDLTNSIKSLLGPERFSQYQNFEQTQPQRELVNQLAQRLSYTATPLSPRQQEQLVQTLASTATTTVTKPAGNVGGKPVPAKQVVVPVPPIAPLNGALAGLGIASASSSPVTTAAIAQSQNFLSPPQVAALQRVQQEQRAQQTLNSVLTAKSPAPATKPAKTGGK